MYNITEDDTRWAG